MKWVYLFSEPKNGSSETYDGEMNKDFDSVGTNNESSAIPASTENNPSESVKSVSNSVKVPNVECLNSCIVS